MIANNFFSFSIQINFAINAKTNRVGILVKKFIVFITLFLYLFSVPTFSQVDQGERTYLYFDIPRVMIASGTRESILDVPASMFLITRREIEKRGYSNLAEILADVPGFDLSLTNGTTYLLAYQRGYRTPWTQRTLLMVNGREDNNLWSHQAEISRQYPLSNIEKIEILYGPASAVYGPNAFLGIINIVTKDLIEMEENEHQATAIAEFGSWNTRNIDIGISGKENFLSYELSGRIFRSDEPDFSDSMGYLTNDYFSSPTIWGPILNMEHYNEPLGKYFDPTDDYGVLGRINIGNVLEIGLVQWRVREAYGPYYAADRVQNNSFWVKDSTQVYVNFKKDLTDTIKSSTSILYRDSNITGSWIEAKPDWDTTIVKPPLDYRNYSYVSYTDWSSLNNSWRFDQKFEVTFPDRFNLNVGLKYERKELTKAYDIPGYWGVYSSTDPSCDPGPYGHGTGVGHSTDDVYIRPTPPSSTMPSDNLIFTDDVGGYVLAIADRGNWRYNLGVRYDHNTVYGSSVNPRLSFIYKFDNDAGSVKLLYGEAFQEPAPVQLWGGWSGRNENPDLKPEKARSLELITLLGKEICFHTISIYYSIYEDVIMEDALNLDGRKIHGAEYVCKFVMPNFLTEAPDITGYVNFSYTKTVSDKTYNHSTGTWVDDEGNLGDIAPYKFNLGFNMPFSETWFANLRSNFVSKKELYTRNPLRNQGEDLDSYIVLNLTVSGRLFGTVYMVAKINNLLDEEYFHSGVEAANAGNNYTSRSSGFMNSIIPQPERNYSLKIKTLF